jgi:hypothetical protein
LSALFRNGFHVVEELETEVINGLLLRNDLRALIEEPFASKRQRWNQIRRVVCLKLRKQVLIVRFEYCAEADRAFRDG